MDMIKCSVDCENFDKGLVSITGGKTAEAGSVTGPTSSLVLTAVVSDPV